MTKTDAAAQKQLHAVARELTAIRFRLLGVIASLTVGLPGAVAGGGPKPEAKRSERAKEMRSVVECVLADDICPAIDDLLAAARYPAGRGRAR